MAIQDNQWRQRPGNDFFAEQDRAFSDYIGRLGHVAVGEIKPLPLPADARRMPAAQPPAKP
jgi:hypothetical protein